MENASNKLGILSLQYHTFPDEVGGAWGWTYEVNKRLAARGHRVHLLTCKPREDLPDREVIDGVDYDRIPKRHSKNIFRLWRAVVKRLDAIPDRNSIDLVHVHNPLVGFLALLHPRLRPIPKVYHFHSCWYDEEKINRRAEAEAAGKYGLAFRLKLSIRLALVRRMEYFCYKRAKSVLFLSDYSKKRFLQYYSSRKPRLRVIPGGVDVDMFFPPPPIENIPKLRGRLGLPVDGPLLLTVRRLEARMGLENLIAATGEVVQNRPESRFHLVIAGKGTLAANLEALVRQWELEERVHLVGLIPREELPLYYRAADLFLLPTTALEGFGLATVEALASGVPVLGTKVGGTVEVLRAIDDKLLFPGTEPAGLATGIERFLNDPDSFHALKGRCRLEAVQKYSWEKVVDRVEEEFLLIERNRPRPTRRGGQ